jgi:hypothetical protein
MRDCTKAQTENYKGEERVRCVHPQAPYFKQYVGDEVCAACPLRVPRPRATIDLDITTLAPTHGGQLWLEHGQFVEKTGGEEFLLGDWIECHLTALGITKEKWVEIKSSVGLAPTCECDARKEWLNQVGTKFGNAIKQRFYKLWY